MVKCQRLFLDFSGNFKRSLCSLFSPDVKQGSHYVLTVNCFKTITIFTLLWALSLYLHWPLPPKRTFPRLSLTSTSLKHRTKMFFRVIVKKRKKKRAALCRCLKKVLEDLVRLDMFNNNLLRNRLIIIFSLFETLSQLGNKNRSRHTQ